MDFFIFLMIAYLIGSIPSAIIVSKLFKLPNPTEQGSGNPGATNMLRINGKKSAFFTLLGDILKGVIVILLAKWYEFQLVNLLIVMFITIIGHCYPLFNRFIGGKGVATYFGTLTFINPYVALFSLTIWLIAAKLIKISSLSAILSLIITPLFAYFYGWNFEPTLYLSAICLFIIYRHKSNILRMINKTEK